MPKVTQLEPEDFKRVEPLFNAFDYDRSLIGGVLERRQIGRIFCEDVKSPRFAVLYHPGKYGHLAGYPENADLNALVVELPRTLGIDVAVQELFLPRNTSWIAHLRAAFGDRLRSNHYKYFKFTDARVDWIRQWPQRLPEGMQVKRMDNRLALKAQREIGVVTAKTWLSIARFISDGFGFVALGQNGQIAGAISTFAIGEGEAEIDIATHRDHRRRGLASLMGCAFIAHSLAHNLRPSWTTKLPNLGSVATARKLGFVDRFVMPCFSIEAGDYDKDHDHTKQTGGNQ